jgi:hypothetical protein
MGNRGSARFKVQGVTYERNCAGHTDDYQPPIDLSEESASRIRTKE